MFSLRYLRHGAVCPHRWTDCITLGDAISAPCFRNERWRCCVRFEPNGLHFLTLRLCWNHPLSIKGGDLILKQKQGQIWWAGLVVYVWASVNSNWGVNRWYWEKKCHLHYGQVKFREVSVLLWDKGTFLHHLVRLFLDAHNNSTLMRSTSTSNQSIVCISDLFTLKTYGMFLSLYIFNF